MPPSQLKKLKASLRDSGVVGQQKSKKQKRQASQNGAFKDSRMQKNATLKSIREQYNPFEFKLVGRSKHEVTSNGGAGSKNGVSTMARPGMNKRLGEENRRKTLLVEMQRRKKVGGIMDRRFGETDTQMTPEEKALQRFVAENQRGSKKGAVFNLEDSDGDDDLTHLGKSISFDVPSKLDDFSDTGLESSDDRMVNNVENGERPKKRRRLSDTGEAEANDANSDIGDFPERQKTKHEVMKEVISKSKLHKYERQQAKEDDDDLRAELDKGLPDLFALLRKAPASTPNVNTQSHAQGLNGAMNPDRAALLNGKERSQADKEYDQRLRQMAMDQRAKPTVPTLTDEEKAAQEAQQLQDLEKKRLRRMKGEQIDSDSESDSRAAEHDGKVHDEEDDEDAFGLGLGLSRRSDRQDFAVEDEDDFVLDDDLIASGSADEMSDEAGSDSASDFSHENTEDEAEFVQGLVSGADAGREGLSMFETNAVLQVKGTGTDLAFTFQCPQSHHELLEITKDLPLSELPTVVQRIRALYQPQLASNNKAKLGIFATVLVDHISYLSTQPNHPSFAVIEALIRHIHSLAKTFPEEVSRAFRTHLKAIHELRPTVPTAGDLTILTAIGSIFPTSDHFHQVVTPAMLCMTRYLGQKIPSNLTDLAMGSYVSSLCLNYQRIAKRYIPEVVNFLLNAIYALSPTKPKPSAQAFPQHILSKSLQINPTYDASRLEYSRSKIWDVFPSMNIDSSKSEEELKYTLLMMQVDLAGIMADLWVDKPAFCEIFGPIHVALHCISDKASPAVLRGKLGVQLQAASQKIRKLLEASFKARKPLRLHNHRPLAIKTSIPKFEESYNPDKHYDPDRDRAELSKLKAEHRKERKGALRELRKDANFMAREGLREKKERDDAYEKKYKRLVAEIQGEEGREANLYEREKRMRKSKK